MPAEDPLLLGRFSGRTHADGSDVESVFYVGTPQHAPFKLPSSTLPVAGPQL